MTKKPKSVNKKELLRKVLMALDIISEDEMSLLKIHRLLEFMGKKLMKIRSAKEVTIKLEPENIEFEHDNITDQAPISVVPEETSRRGHW
jgi:divalent metal cation (Fe/Co/Zn/Cd) transporter